MNTQLSLNLPGRGAVTLMPDWEDHQLLDGLREFDARAISVIYDRYSADVYRYVRYRLNDDHVAQDTSSDVFLRLLEAVRDGRAPRLNLRGWLLSTANHMVNDHLRRAYRRPTSPLAEELPDPRPAPSDEYDRREQARNFVRAYALLTDEQQHVLALRFGEDYSLEDTASVLQKNVNAVKALQFRALAALERHMRKTPHE